MQTHKDMPQNIIFKLMHITLIIILAAIILVNLYFGEIFHVFFSNSNQECASNPRPLSGSQEDTLYRKKQLSENIWLYITQYNGPLAISPIVYRYYLEEKINSDPLPELRKRCPFLEADHENAEISFSSTTGTHTNNINVKMTGKIYSFNNHCKFTNAPLNIFINTIPKSLR